MITLGSIEYLAIMSHPINVYEALRTRLKQSQTIFKP